MAKHGPQQVRKPLNPFKTLKRLLAFIKDWLFALIIVFMNVPRSGMSEKSPSLYSGYLLLLAAIMSEGICILMSSAELIKSTTFMRISLVSSKAVLLDGLTVFST